jgi:RNA polymerase sigma-70 factor (ECF subfamily)
MGQSRRNAGDTLPALGQTRSAIGCRQAQANVPSPQPMAGCRQLMSHKPVVGNQTTEVGGQQSDLFSLTTELWLVKRACSGDRTAQQELWRSHRRWVAAIVLAHRPHGVDVDDLMQEVAVKLVSKISSLRDVESFRPWLRQIAINVCRGAARSLRSAGSGRSANGAGLTAESQRPTSDSREAVERHDAAARLMQQVLTLPPEYREPLLLRCVRSMSYQQIADVLQLPVTTVETRLARARRMLREELGEQAEQGSRLTAEQPSADSPEMESRP